MVSSAWIACGSINVRSGTICPGVSPYEVGLVGRSRYHRMVCVVVWGSGLGASWSNVGLSLGTLGPSP